MNRSISKIVSLSLGLIVSASAAAETRTFSCPSLHGSYTSEQEVNQWFFWADKRSRQVDIEQWQGQKVRNREGKFYNYGLVCSAGTDKDYYGVMLPVKAESCKAIGAGTFTCVAN
jgi:hypothetical protein